MADPVADLRCSTQARGSGLDPAGTAVASNLFVLVELALPWPSDIADHPGLRGAAGLTDLGARVQGVVGDPERLTDGGRSVVVHHHGVGAFRRYRRTEVCLAPGTDLVGAVRRAVADSPAPPAGDGDVVDLLLCTHGSRDRCCGSLGASLARTVAFASDVRLRRTSHLGGHRFAPTALVLPYGTVWAWLDEHLLDAVLARSLEPAVLVDHYRGSTAMPTPALQVTERSVFAAVGWPWLDAERAGQVEAAGPDRWAAHIDSTLGSWEAVVERIGTTPQPVCGQAPPAGAKRDEHLRVVELRQLR